MAFDQAAVLAVVDSVVSHALKLGVFDTVNQHEPKSAPGNGLHLAIWANEMAPIPMASGLAAASGKVVINARIYGNFMSKPEDDIDPRLMTAATTLLGAYCGDFDFGATVRNVDIFGAYGTAMNALAGYLTLDSRLYRVMTITLPIILNDMWTLGA